MATLRTMCGEAQKLGYTHLVASNGNKCELGDIGKFKQGNSQGWFFNGSRPDVIMKIDRKGKTVGYYILIK